MVPDAKIINVIRDPKDVYADSLRVKWLAIPKDKSKYIKCIKIELKLIKNYSTLV